MTPEEYQQRMTDMGIDRAGFAHGMPASGIPGPEQFYESPYIHRKPLRDAPRPVRAAGEDLTHLNPACTVRLQHQLRKPKKKKTQ